MILLRLLTIALCTACVILLASLPVRVTVVSPAAPPAAVVACHGASRLPEVTVVDVAAGVALPDLDRLLHLRPGEQVIAINDRPLADRQPPMDLIAELSPRAGDYLDLTVAGEVTERRVLMLLH